MTCPPATPGSTQQLYILSAWPGLKKWPHATYTAPIALSKPALYQRIYLLRYVVPWWWSRWALPIFVLRGQFPLVVWPMHLGGPRPKMQWDLVNRREANTSSQMICRWLLSSRLTRQNHLNNQLKSKAMSDNPVRIALAYKDCKLKILVACTIWGCIYAL